MLVGKRKLLAVARVMLYLEVLLRLVSEAKMV